MILLLTLISFLLHFQPAHAGMEDMFFSLTGRPTRSKPKVIYTGNFTQSKVTDPQHDKLKTQHHDLDGTLPLGNGLLGSSSLKPGLEFDKIDSPAKFANGRSLPRNLWNPKLAYNFLYSDAMDGTKTGFSLGFSSPSDRPYHSWKALEYQITGYHYLPGSMRDGWIFFLDESNGRDRWNYYPLPGFSYFFQASQSLRLFLGVPMNGLFYTPIEGMVLSAFFFPFKSGQLKLSYFIFNQAQAYIGVKTLGKKYILSDRISDKERLYMENVDSFVGISNTLEENLAADISLHYKANRKIFLTEQISDIRAGETLEPDAAFAIEAKLIGSF